MILCNNNDPVDELILASRTGVSINALARGLYQRPGAVSRTSIL